MEHAMVRGGGPSAGALGGSTTFAFGVREGWLSSEGASLTDGDGRADPIDSVSISDSARVGSTGVRLVDT